MIQIWKITIKNELNYRKKHTDALGKEDIIEPSDIINEPVEHPKDKTIIEPEAYGWSFYSYDEERGEAYNSIILDAHGKPTEIWFVGDNEGELPNRYPSKWNMRTLVYNDNRSIMPNIMIEELTATQQPNNWAISLDNIRTQQIGWTPDYAPGTLGTPDYAPGTPVRDPHSPLDSPPDERHQFVPRSPSNSPPDERHQFVPRSPSNSPDWDGSPSCASFSPRYSFK